MSRSRHIRNNTTLRIPTHFPMAPEVITQADKELVVGSENWSYPIGETFGHPEDTYYSEIWHCGMDWNAVFWIVEKRDFDEPDARPLMIFDDLKERAKISEHDFSELCKYLLRATRGWPGDREGANCDFWCHVKMTREVKTFPSTLEDGRKLSEVGGVGVIMREVSFGHASMEEAKFWVEQDALPAEVGNVDDPPPVHTVGDGAPQLDGHNI